MPKDKFEPWLENLFSTDPKVIDNEIEADLVELIGDSWIFDPKALLQKTRGQAVGQ